MDFIQKQREENNPYYQLFMVILYALVGIIVFLFLAIMILFAIYGMDLVNNPEILRFADIKYRSAMQIVLVAQSIGLFLAPAILLAVTERKKVNVFYGISIPKLKWMGMVLLIMIVSMPFMEWTAVINQKMVLPDFLKGVEEWMRNSEDELMKTTLMLLKMDAVNDLFLTAFVIAIVPAVCEELMFRGVLQRIFTRIFKNPHIAIWVSAFLFSAMHLQFYGFLPRFLLGAGFGYIYFYTHNLWYNIFAHFLNNAYAVCMAYYMQHHNMDWTKADSTPQFAWYGYIISFILTAMVFYFLKNKAQQHMNNDWIKIYTTQDPYRAEITKQILLENDIEAVVLNKQDSSYKAFGEITVLVQPEKADKAIQLLSQSDFE